MRRRRRRDLALTWVFGIFMVAFAGLMLWIALVAVVGVIEILWWLTSLLIGTQANNPFSPG